MQDDEVNRYVGRSVARCSSAPSAATCPFSYRTLNANYINAYTFPGGAMGVTRGILVEHAGRIELAALFRHELGHVNARHAAQRQGQALVAQAVVAAGGSHSDPGSPLVVWARSLGASAMLAAATARA